MARKPKRMSRKELKRPDEVQVALQGFWDWIEDHWKLLVAGAVGLLAVGVASSVVGGMTAENREEQAQALRGALAPLMAPIGEEAQDPTRPATPTDVGSYSTAAEAREAAVGRLEAFLAEQDGDNSAARFALTAVGSEDPAGRIEGLGAWLEANPGTSLEVAARLAMADAHVRAGQRDEALNLYREIAESRSGKLRAMAWMQVGDLQNPLLFDEGDLAEARTAYESAREALGPKPQAQPGDILAQAFGEPYLHAQLDDRLAVLP